MSSKLVYLEYLYVGILNLVSRITLSSMVIYEWLKPRYVDITYMYLNHIDMVNINLWG